jgi:hypothetical protein
MLSYSIGLNLLIELVYDADSECISTICCSSVEILNFYGTFKKDAVPIPKKLGASYRTKFLAVLNLVC